MKLDDISVMFEENYNSLA